MPRLTVYINNKYYVATFISSSSTLINLNDTIPQLNDIVPKHIVCDVKEHFILDTNNRLHMINYKYSTTNFYYNIWSGSAIDSIMMKVHIFSENIKVLLFGFNKSTNTFIVETTRIGNINGPVKHKTHKPVTKYIHNIKNYTFIHYDSIMLNGFNDDTYVYNSKEHQFNVFYGINHKLRVGEKVYMEHNNNLYDTKTVMGNNTRNLLIGPMVAHMLNNLFYYYDGRYRDMVIRSKNNYLAINNTYISMSPDMSTYITTIIVCGIIYVIFETDIFCVQGWCGTGLRLPLCDNTVKSNMITHGLTKLFEWTRDTHKCFSSDTKDVVGTIIMCNKFTKYKRVPKYLLFTIINLFIK